MSTRVPPTNYAYRHRCPNCGWTWEAAGDPWNSRRYRVPEFAYHLLVAREAARAFSGHLDTDTAGVKSRRFSARGRMLEDTLFFDWVRNLDTRQPVGAFEDASDPFGMRALVENTRLDGVPRDMFAFRVTLEGERWRAKEGMLPGDTHYEHADCGAAWSAGMGSLPVPLVRTVAETVFDLLPGLFSELGADWPGAKALLATASDAEAEANQNPQGG